jgi:Fur family ferric uptake transcriptional regulator
MNDARQHFTSYLSAKKLKITPQRLSVLETILKTSGHVTPEEIYAETKRADPGIGLATVYRTLKLLADAGLAHEIRFGDGVSRYEMDKGGEHHDHIICTECDKNLEVMDPEIEQLQEKLAEKSGFTLTGHKMFLYGVCSECRNNRKSDKKAGA